jgi:diacylglycerol O-acyltransferase / wax synthase
MQRLTGLDAAFLYMETPTSPMHVAALQILDPSTMPDGELDAETIKQMISERLHLAPPFRRRLAEVPFGLHHPLWIEDPDFDLDDHVHHIALPAPGGDRELANLVGHLMAIPLDRSRPLWEMWIIEGVAGGKFASFTKTHHAAIDGVSGNEMTVALLDLTPEITRHEAPEWVADKVPTDMELLSYAVTSLSRQPVAAAKAARRTVEGILTQRRHARQPDVEPPPASGPVPSTSFNKAITPRRSYAFKTVSLSDVKAIKNATGATVNDVVLALCGGALKKYLDHIGEKPDASLVAMVPVSVRTDDEQGAGGNRVSSMACSMATDIDDPIERLGVIHEHTKHAKEQLKAIGADTLTNWAEFAAPAVAGLAARLASRVKIMDRITPPFNVTVSNVPGPPFDLYSGGARLEANYPCGPINEGAGINMTVISYKDQLDFGLVACPDLIDDVWFIADALVDTLEELKVAAGVAPVTVPAKAVTKPKSKAATKSKGPAAKPAPKPTTASKARKTTRKTAAKS